MTADALAGWVLGNFIWASAAMLLVLALRRPVARHLGAGVAYALWLIPALRLIAPPLDWLAALFPADLPSLPPLVLFVDAGEAAPLPSHGPGQWVPILLAVWAGGATLFLIIQAGCYRRFLRRLSLSLRNAGAHRGVPLIESAAVDGPLALGLFHRRIVVPTDFQQRYTPAERALALEHERHHHACGDILANHVALVVLALNWFNPIAWFAFRAFRADQELSCDAAIAAAAPPETRCDYARALVKSASRPGLIAACPLNHADQLKRRLRMLTHHRKDRRRLIAGSGLTVLLIVTSMAFGGPGQAQDKSQTKEEHRERMVIIEDHHEGGAGGQANDHEVIRRNLSPDVAARVENCSGNDQLINVNEGEGNQRTRIMICAHGSGAASAASRAEALQHARERIASSEHMSAETKQRVLAQFDAAIARARGGN
jgi:beta-lactamase regulating signal transducer with metallopeptidase domain